MKTLADAAAALRAAAAGCERSQIAVALDLLEMADGNDLGFDLLAHLYALCFARLAAAQGSYDALNLSAHLSAALAQMVPETLLAPRRAGFQGDALALFDVATDRAPASLFDEAERNLQTLTDRSDPESVVVALAARKFWTFVVQPDLEQDVV